MAAASTTRPLGMLEWDSIAAGLDASDALLKEAPVDARVLRPVTPGRYVALFEGEVEAVRTAIRTGSERQREALVDSLFLPQPHPELLTAIGGRKPDGALDAIGIIETVALCTLLLAADGAAKTGAVQLLDIRLAMGLGGKAFVILTGEVSDVESAIAEGTRLAQERGYHLRSIVIPRPDDRLLAEFTNPVAPFSDVEI